MVTQWRYHSLKPGQWSIKCATKPPSPQTPSVIYSEININIQWNKYKKCYVRAYVLCCSSSDPSDPSAHVLPYDVVLVIRTRLILKAGVKSLKVLKQHGNAWVQPVASDALAPHHQYPQCWLNIQWFFHVEMLHLSWTVVTSKASIWKKKQYQCV